MKSGVPEWPNQFCIHIWKKQESHQMVIWYMLINTSVLKTKERTYSQLMENWLSASIDLLLKAKSKIHVSFLQKKILVEWQNKDPFLKMI